MTEPLARLSSTRERAARLRLRADEMVDVEVRLTRAAGHTWAQIGEVLDTTRQAVYERYGSPKALLHRLDVDARAAFRHADTEARRMGHAYLGTEHVLLGILLKPPQQLKDAMGGDITVRSVRREIIEIVGTARTRRPRNIRMAPRLRRAAEIAGESAARAGRYEVTSADLVRGMIAEAGGIGVQALAGLGVDLDALARALTAYTTGR